MTEREDEMQQQTRRERGLERLAQLGDEPGGDAFIERMGSPMGDWLVDWVFGEVHTRDGLTARDIQWVPARRPRNRPAAPSTSEPVQIPTT